MARSASGIPSPLLPIFSNTKQGFFYNEVLIKNILSLTSGPIELDLEAGNLVEDIFETMNRILNEKLNVSKIVGLVLSQTSFSAGFL